MRRVVVILFVAVAVLVVARIVVPVILIGAAILLVVAWRWPEALQGLIGHQSLARAPSFVRATPMRFAATTAAAAVVIGLASTAIGAPGGAAGDDEVAAASVAASQASAAASTPRATPTATPNPSPTPDVTAIPTTTLAPTPAFGLEPTGPVEVATVASVTDGDTIRVLLDGENVPVRYIGIDTPETQNGAEAFGQEAADANARLVAGQSVFLERDVSETDQYGRLLRYVWIQNETGWLLVNLELLRLGFAQVTTYPPDVKYVDALYLPAQQAARESGIGLWGTAAATPAPIVPLVPGSNCELSYPDICIPIGSSDLDCPDIEWRRFTVLWNVANPDPHRFDGDADGIGCES